MKRIIPKIIISLLAILAVSSSSCDVVDIIKIIIANDMGIKTDPENQEKILSFEEQSHRFEMYWAIYTYNTDNVKKYLEEGYDPDKSKGEEGYRVSTPLGVITWGHYNTYFRKQIGEIITEPPPDIEIFNLLIDANANINNRPYVWERIHFAVENHVKGNKTLSRTGKIPASEEEKEELMIENLNEVNGFFIDRNRILLSFLEAGADPDMRGHPYPFTLEAKRARITDKEAIKYFAKGTRPINEAIKNGIRWESQVDLLLQYTTLDKDSLKAAKKSKDPAMIQKINKLWKEQNAM